MTTSVQTQTSGNAKRAKWVAFLQEYGAQLAFGPALAAMLGSLYYSEIAGFAPCELCWYQRILMYPLTVIILVGIFNEDRMLPKYVLPLSITGMGVSTYHYLLQNHVFGGAQVCSFGVSCSLRYVNIWGFVTIPFMALTAFTMITLLMLATNWAYNQEDPLAEGEEEWNEA